MPIAITRAVSPAIARCELTHLERQPIDFDQAVAQHRAYEACLAELGAQVVSLPAEPELPDSMFVEDPAVVVDEVAVLTRMGAESRRAETESLAAVLARYRPLARMCAPATLEGGDVMRIGRTLYVGLSSRTNAAGVWQLREALAQFEYEVRGVEVRGCLHFKSACSPLGGDAVLANRGWIDEAALKGLEVIDVPQGEARAANVLAIGGTVVVPAAFPKTAEMLEGRGWKVRTLDISELMKAEAGLTCSSILLDGQ
jgi:dimethylargininase